jgi:YNFM family putative membrane transporter
VTVASFPVPPPHQRGSRGYRRIAIGLFAAGLATFTSLYSVQALLPDLARSFTLSPAAASLALSAATAALAVGIIPLTALSEAVGRVPVMTVSLFAAAALGVVQALSPGFTVLLILRALQGLALAGLQAVAMSYLAEELHPDALGSGMGLFVAGNGIGGMSGRLLAGLIADLAGWRWAVAVIGLIALACAVAFRLAIVPSARQQRRPLRPAALAGSVRAACADSGLIRLYAAGFLLMGCFVTIYNYLGFRLLGPGFWLSRTVVGLIFVCYLAGSAASAAAGRLADRAGRPPVLLIAVAVTLAGVLLMAPDELPMVLAGLLVTTAGFFAAHTVASSWVGARSRKLGAQGASVYLFCYYLGSSVGGSAGGLAYGAAGWAGVTGYGTALLAGVIVLALTLRRLRPAVAAWHRRQALRDDDLLTDRTGESHDLHHGQVPDPARAR